MSRTIIVTGKPPGLRQVISIGPHQLVPDEASEAGSTDEGPDPYEYLLASLGACTNMTLRMYANHKGWPIKQIETTLSHSKSYAMAGAWNTAIFHMMQHRRRHNTWVLY